MKKEYLYSSEADFWCVSCKGNCASGVWFPFDCEQHAIDYVRKTLKDKKLKIINSGLNNDNNFFIRTVFDAYPFDIFIIFKRKANEIVKHEHIE